MNRRSHCTPPRSSRWLPAPTVTRRALMHGLALTWFAICGPATAQLYAPSSRLAAPAQIAPAADVCAPVPQGQGSASEACRRECARNPQYSPSCAKPAAPNWGAPVVGAPAAAPPAQPGPLPASPASRQFGGGSVRTLQGGNANSGAMKYERPVQPSVIQAAPALPAGAVAPAVPANDANRGAAKIERPTVAPMSRAAPAAASAPVAVASAAAPAAAATTKAVSQPVSSAPAAASTQTPVTATGGTLTGSASPGGVPAQAPSSSASTTAANSIAPGKVEPPKFDRAAFDVDFGQAYSGDQVRRTVVLNTSARGEAEFSLTIPNAPGFAITEVRVMGQGVTAPAMSTTQAPLPSNAPRPLQDMAVRKVASSVKAPPWKVQFNGPSEVQVDVLYAPTVDLFNNLIGKKMGVLNGVIRNTAGADGASIALRADFRGLKEVNAASLKPREKTAYVVSDSGTANFAIAFDVASLGARIDGVLRQAADIPGFRLVETPVRLQPGGSAVVTVKGQFVAASNAMQPDGRARTIPVTLSWNGGTSNSSVDVIPLPASKTFQTEMMSNCGVSSTHAIFTYSANEGSPSGSANLALRSDDPLRNASIFVEARAGGQRICSVYNSIYGAKHEYARFKDVCSHRIEDYARIVAGPIEFRCVSMSCVGPTPEMCDAAMRDRQEHPERWRR